MAAVTDKIKSVVDFLVKGFEPKETIFDEMGEEIIDDEYETEDNLALDPAYTYQPRQEKNNELKVVNHPNYRGYEVIVMEPRSFDDAAQIVQHLKDRKTIVLNQQQGKIIPVSSGLGDEVVEIPMDANGGMGCSMLNKSDSGVLVNVTTLDKFVEENNIKVGLIKTDVEGFEQNLLKGAMKTIKEQKPALLISIYHNGSDLFDIKPMIESWNLGYKFKVRKSINNNITVDAMLICEVI